MPKNERRLGAVSLLGPPYSHLEALDLADPVQPREGGWIMAWNLDADDWSDATDLVANRLAGVALVVILPRDDDRSGLIRILRAIETTRPQAVMPHHKSPQPQEIAQVIRRPPVSLASSVSDYMRWRGFALDPATRSTIRRTFELSASLSTITELARNLYMSRRALGRRFLKNRLPVPSHWLHIARLIRATMKLQNSTESLFQVATSLGYPDGFSMSNQMHRLCGIRPQHVRARYGWEWVFECWLARELAIGAVTSDVVRARPSVADAAADPSGSDGKRTKRSTASSG